MLKRHTHEMKLTATVAGQDSHGRPMKVLISEAEVPHSALPEAKGRDVGMAVAQGETRPIREVLAEQKKNHNAQGKALREEAFRVRAGMQAMLMSCLCCYPLVKAETESEHEEWCPAHGMHVSREAALAAKEQSR